MQPIRDFTTELVWTLVAVAGGVAKHLNGILMNNQPWKPVLLLARAFISGFSGYMFAKTATLLLANQQWAMVAAGIGGYLGTQGIEYIVLLLKARFNFPSGQ